jgi:hypothetical protein
MAAARVDATIAASTHDEGTEVCPMTLVWFVVWLVCDLSGDKESLTFDPVNGWAGTLILAIALDLGRQHAPVGRRG